MATKSEAAKALRSYFAEVEAQIAQTEAKQAELRAELDRIESALETIGGGGGARTPPASVRRSGAAERATAPATAKAVRKRRQQRVKPEERERQIVSALSKGPLSVKEVATRLKLGRSRARTLLSELKQRGVLNSERDGNGPRARELYSLPQPNRRSSSKRPTNTRKRPRKSAKPVPSP
jgi:DNA-binding transcriptional ArsR family regulator